MRLPRFDYAEARSTREACRLLEAGGDQALPIAGGTELLVALKYGQKQPRMLVDLGGIRSLRQIRYSQRDGLSVGAMVSLRHLSAHPVVREKYPILAQAAQSVGTVQLQAMGTVGGNLCQDTCCMNFNRSAMAREPLVPCHKLGGEVCHVVGGSPECWASYTGDLAPALLVLRAKIKLADSGGAKIVPLSELFSGDGKRPHTLRPGQIITEIQVPSPAPHSGGSYLKLRQREIMDYPLMGLAVYLTLDSPQGICTDAALALTAVGQGPVVVQEADGLRGQELTADRIQELAGLARKKAHPLKNLCGLEAPYRLKMVQAYAESAFEQALQSASR